MPRKKQLMDGESQCVQINVRITPTLEDRLKATASRLGLDGSNLVRLILYECLPDYEVRAKRLPGRRESKAAAGDG